jgi:carboxyl-terminal processing protease
MTRSRVASSLVGLAVAGVLAASAVVSLAAPEGDLFALRKNLRIFGAVYEKVVTGYVEPVEPGRLMEVGVEAMLDELDPYTTFLGASENARIDIMTEGQYGGVGLQIGRRNGRIAVVAPVVGASGSEQGVRTGDVMTTVAGQSTEGLSVEDVKTLLRGEPGTTVRLTVERAGTAAPRTLTLTRERVKLPTVTYAGRIGPTEQVAYVKLKRFTRTAPAAVERALRRLRAEASLAEGVVLDLRDNPGGLLRAAVGVTGLFVPRGATIVSTRGREDSVRSAYRNDRVPLVPEAPVVVLVNGQSASASEIVAGALQDRDRGVVLGTTTYGKGLVQNVRSLPHNTALKLTTAQYYTPSGRTIQSLGAAGTTDADAATGRTHETRAGRTVHDGDGIAPDVRVREPAPSALERALTRRSAFFRYANHYAATHDTLAAGFSVGDVEVGAFRDWLARANVQYPTRAERMLDSVRARTNGGARVKATASKLAEALEAARKTAFERHAPALRRHLAREILARYVPARRQTALLLPADIQATAAVELLQEPDRYERLLTPAGSR